LRLASADAVIVDAPCSGLGVLRRRADARWRIRPSDIDELAVLQRQLLDAALGLVRPGGRLLYSVCTLTAAETTEVAASFEAAHPGLVSLAPPDGDWDRWGSGGLLLPQTDDTDGMALFRWRVPS
jgi:16S rRNA (cytosine967-C5)-methyltransferase